MREKSSTLSISRDSRSDSRVMIAAYSRPFSGVLTLPSIRSSANMRIKDSGVLSSWLTLLMNSDFMALTRCSVEMAYKRKPVPITMTPSMSPIRLMSESCLRSALARSRSDSRGAITSRQPYTVVSK